MSKHIFAANSWAEARLILNSICPGLPIFFGTGHAISTPHVRAIYLDSEASEGIGYRVIVRQDGDGYGNAGEHYLIYVKQRDSQEDKLLYHHPQKDDLVISEDLANYAA